MKADGLAVVQGWPETVATLHRWRRAPGRRLGEWALGSLAVTVFLLAATWYVALLSPADPTPYVFPGLTQPAHVSDFTSVLYRNSLVLGLHAMACVAGFIAGSAPKSHGDPPGPGDRVESKRPGSGTPWAEGGRVHRDAGRLAMGFVTVATLFSLSTQALALGSAAATLAAQLRVSPLHLLLALTPHAVPELFALFLPLAAWTLAAHRRAGHELLAATLVTTAVAVPLLVGAGAVETWVTPGLLARLHG
jgi:hypothetical protein